MTDRFAIAHVSDVHLAPLPPFWPWHWNVKRALGYANWLRKRKFEHRRATTDRMVADLKRQRADHIVVSGDLTNIGMPREHEWALRWLEALGSPQDISVIPGNHDIYCRLWSDRGTQRWAPYAANFAPELGELMLVDGTFPFVRQLGDCVLVGVNSAVPTPPVLAVGEVGREQLERLDRILEVLSTTRFCRVVVVHHPPMPGQAKPTRALKDAGKLKQILARHGAELVLHGHNHRNMLDYCSGPKAQFAVVGVGSLSMGRRRAAESLAAYNLYFIERADQGFSIEMVQRGLTEPDGDVVEIGRHVLSPAAPVMDKQS
ncbi:MAG: metallophosphoesterase family protein [Hyphomicrobiaceae bacterium]